MNDNLNYYISIYFKDYLPKVIGVSKNTLLSYRDTFLILLEYLENKLNRNINKLKINDITCDEIRSFLNFLEENKHNSISTRNQRLAAIHSFYKFLKTKELSYLDLFTQILSIPFKKAPKNTITYFSKNEISILINCPNALTKNGYRDYVLLLLMYETATRVQEICDIKKNSIQFKETYTYVTITGKGNKTRTVPINSDLSLILKDYFDTFKISDDDYLFKNKNNNKLTTKGISYIFSKYVHKSQNSYPEKFKEHYSPHSMRHSKAMHLLESGVNLIYIRDFLGHESVITTEIYAKANPVVKEKQIIEHAYNITNDSKYTDNTKEELLNFLKTL